MVAQFMPGTYLWMLDHCRTQALDIVTLAFHHRFRQMSSAPQQVNLVPQLPYTIDNLP